MAPTPRRKRDSEELGRRPSMIFGRRIQERRRALDWSQTELAEAMTHAGFEMSKTAILRIENGTRELKLDEAIAFAQVLHVPFAYLLEPPADDMLALTEDYATDGDGLTRWLVTGTPLGGFVWPGEMRTRQDRELAAAYLREIAWAAVTAANAQDAEGLKHAKQRWEEMTKRLREQVKSEKQGPNHPGGEDA